MARPLRIQVENGLYHVISRGNERSLIFIDDMDRRVFLKRLSEVAERYVWVVYAYCLMGNHFHLLVRTVKANISQSMRQLNGTYAQYFNKRHARVGHVFQGRFKIVLILDEERLLTAARYLVLNPVRAGLVNTPEAWPWSSYRATVGVGKPPTFLDPDQVLCNFSDRQDEARREYAAFVNQGIGGESPFKDARGGIIMAEDESAREVFEEIGTNISSEIPRRERFAARLELDEIFSSYGKEEGIYLAVHKHGYKLKEIGDFLGMHYSVVSRIAKKVAQRFSAQGPAP